MPDILDANGLTVKTRTEIVDELGEAYRGIYGEDINIDQNSPDGQVIGIMAQMAVDIREQLVNIYNSFNPNRAIGVVLDERAAINNVVRAGATFTTINISITVDRTLTLQGLDADYFNVNGTGFTVQDNAGNQFILIDTTTITAGTHSLAFRAREIGMVETVIGTIQTPVTIVLGVTGINNPVAATNIGVNEESDPTLRLRRARSIALSSNGYQNGIEGALMDVSGVSDAVVYENDTSITDSDGTPGNTMWAIVDGGANEDIARVICYKKSFGCGMRGDVTVGVEQANGRIVDINFDRPETQNLYIQFEIQQTTPGYAFDLDGIKAALENTLMYGIGDAADTSRITIEAAAAVLSFGGGGVVINVEISDDGYTWADYLTPTAKDYKFVVEANNISITVVT